MRSWLFADENARWLPATFVNECVNGSLERAIWGTGHQYACVGTRNVALNDSPCGNNRRRRIVCQIRTFTPTQLSARNSFKIVNSDGCEHRIQVAGIILSKHMLREGSEIQRKVEYVDTSWKQRASQCQRANPALWLLSTIDKVSTQFAVKTVAKPTGQLRG